MVKLIKVAFVGPSGSGKDTSASLLQNFLKEKSIFSLRKDVAAPLHDMQEYIYNTLETKPEGEQDTELLAFLAGKFKKDIIRLFHEEIESIKKNIVEKNLYDIIAIINSDCRDNAYQSLKNQGFIFVKVSTDYIKRINRVRTRDKIKICKNSLDSTSKIKEDYIIYNNNSIEDLQQSIIKLWPKIFSHFT
ncbi:MAG: hypothetical protein ACOC56_03430 [Atribacterota bacterium]